LQNILNVLGSVVDVRV